jgi:K+-transporting ATPase ATPase C chain
MIKQWIKGFWLLIILTFITGVIYPFAITGAAQLFFPYQANGSLLVREGNIVGSALLGQNFKQDGYFQGRPSAAGDDGYDATSSSGTNLGPTSAKLLDGLAKKTIELRTQNNLADNTLLPADLVTSSASGLDPDISVQGALVQVNRIATARNISPYEIQNLIANQKTAAQFGLLGESRVNVVKLNMLLDSLAPLP